MLNITGVCDFFHWVSLTFDVMETEWGQCVIKVQYVKMCHLSNLYSKKLGAMYR